MKWNEKVIDLMTTKNINQKELSKLSGITETSISRYLNGKQQPRIDVLVNFARSLEVNVDYLLEDDKKSNYTTIATAIDWNRDKLTVEEKNKLIALIVGNGENK